ncbi:hypothetical protein GCM10025867_32850 [Frondihabitans sucicola]|uniref:ATP synthase protein I n=1 Tax=Frondihabitans sucicola TaxID=1268041 RepID=A0ABM8GRX3_9MICO|nr:hypothetical protein [Frondihabitans sucicola]BDZ51044.1 hypothetical protein GCM10025867_32850 [Frondihabitans sucicola]
MNPANNRIFTRILRLGSLLALGIAVVGCLVGGLTVGATGVTSALVGTALALVFTGMTAASILIGLRASGGSLLSGAFFGIVLGGWLLKFIVFLVIVVLLKDQPWVNTLVMFLSIVVGVVGSLVVDVVVITRSRVGIDVALPGAERANSDK